MKTNVLLRQGAAILSMLLAPAFAMAAPAGADATAPAAHATLPGNSIYQVRAAMVDQDGNGFVLSERRSRPMLVSMFYNSCEFVCPMLIDTIRMTEQSLSAAERAQLGLMLITFDPERDDVKTLKSVFDKRQLEPAQWTLARTDAASVRKIAATLNIQYRRLASGDFNHTTVLVLLDGEGRIVARSKQLGALDPVFLSLIRQTLKDAALTPVDRERKDP